MDAPNMYASDSRTDAHAEVVTRFPATVAGVREMQPDGITQLAWIDFQAVHRTYEVLVWKRLDNWLLPVGHRFDVHVQARQFQDLRLPVHQNSATCVLTNDPTDEAQVLIGDLMNGQWLYGVILQGVRRDDANGPAVPLL